MDEELEKTATNTEENQAEMPETSPNESENAAETAAEANDPNAKAIDYINRFAQGSPTSTPEEIIAGLVNALDVTSVPYDQFSDVAYSSQEAAAFMYDLKETGDPIKALVRNYDPEEIQAALETMNEDDSYEEDRKSYQGKVEGKKAYMAHQEENMKLSQTGAEEFMDEMNPSEEEQTAFIAFTDEFLMDAADNKMTKAHWMELWQAFKYKGDVANAEENGKIIGKNEKIVTGKRTRDDLVHMLPEGGSAIAKKQEVVKPKSFADDFMNGVI